MTGPSYRLVRRENPDRHDEWFEPPQIFHTRAWLDFVARSQRGEIVVADVLDGGEPVGRFQGLVVRRGGIRILGSPMPGWTTSYMGFNLAKHASRSAALAALPSFAFGELRCLHVEVSDRRASHEDFAAPYTAERRKMTTYEIDLSGGPDAAFANLHLTCRQNVRRARRSGVSIVEDDGTDFAEHYHAQLRDVFAKQGLVPTYGIDRIRALIEALMPTGQLLLLKAWSDDGTCIATGIFPADAETMYFWGGASWRAHQKLRPNEALIWHAMQYWMDRGSVRCDMGGGGSYKRRYGAYSISVPRGRASRFPILEVARTARKRLEGTRQRLLGRRLS